LAIITGTHRNSDIRYSDRHVVPLPRVVNVIVDLGNGYAQNPARPDKCTRKHIIPDPGPGALA